MIIINANLIVVCNINNIFHANKPIFSSTRRKYFNVLTRTNGIYANFMLKKNCFFCSMQILSFNRLYFHIFTCVHNSAITNNNTKTVAHKNSQVLSQHRIVEGEMWMKSLYSVECVKVESFISLNKFLNY